MCFSATLHPLPEMRLLLGGTEDDACFAMPSPFPPEHLQIRQVDVNTRYAHRPSACTEIARQITALVTRKPGKYLVFFPSVAFLRMTAERLMLPCQVQEKQMDVLNAIKLFADEGLKSTGGLSNNSNGAPKNVRPIMDSALVAMAMMQGLTSAIANPIDPRLLVTIKSCDIFKNNELYSDS